MNRTALTIMVITVVSKLFGLVRELILSYIYGANYISDAYLVSITIPNAIFGFVAAGLAAGYIPIYSDIITKKGTLEADKFTSNLINILFILSSIIILLTFIFAKQLVGIFASGFEGESLLLTIKLTRITLVAMYFASLVSIFSGYLQIHNNYLIPAATGIIFNILVIVSFILSRFGTIILAVGYVVATASKLLLMLPSINNTYRHLRILDIREENIKKMMNIIMPIILGLSVNQVNILIDRTLASRIVVGGISSLNYANRLTEFILGIFVFSIVTVLYPKLSRMASEKNMSGLKRSINESIIGINIFLIPSMVGTILFNKQIVLLIFGRGAFDENAILLTANALLFYAFGIVGFGIRDLLIRVFYSIKDSRTPMVNAAIGMTINIILNIILSKYMGIGGLAFATSISAIITMLLMFYSLFKRIGYFWDRNMMITNIKIIVAAIIMGIIVNAGFNTLIDYFSDIVSLCVSIFIGVVSYSVIIFFLNIEIIDCTVSVIKQKFIRIIENDKDSEEDIF